MSEDTSHLRAPRLQLPLKMAMSIGRHLGRGISVMLATLEDSQMRWVFRALQPTAADATIVVHCEHSIDSILGALDSSGWTVGGTEALPGDCFRLQARSRPAHGKPNEVARHAVTQLRLALYGHDLRSLQVSSRSDEEAGFYRWGIKLTDHATDADRRILRRAAGSLVVAGTEEQARADIDTLLQENQLRPAIWELVPANSAAAAKYPHTKVLTFGVQAAGLMILAATIAVFVGALSPHGSFIELGGGPPRVASAGVAVFALIAACFLAASLRARHITKAGKPSTWFDVTLVLGGMFLPLTLPAQLAADTFGLWPTMLAFASLLLLLFVSVAFGRPLTLTARLSPRSAGRRAILSISAAVLLLNIPAAMFMLGAGLAPLIGSVPIGNVIATGWPALASAGVVVGFSYVVARLFRRTAGISVGVVLSAYAALLGVAFAGIIFYAAYGRGESVANSGIYDSSWAVGLQAVCVEQPRAGQNGTFWLVGTAGRTSYLLPRYVRGDTAAAPIAVDVNKDLSFTDPDRPCR